MITAFCTDDHGTGLTASAAAALIFAIPAPAAIGAGSGTIAAAPAVRAQICAVLADIHASGAHGGASRAGPAAFTVFLALPVVGALAAIGTDLSAVVARHPAFNADNTAMIAHIVAVQADQGTIDAVVAVVAMGRISCAAVGAGVDIRTDPFGMSAAFFALTAPFGCTFKADLAAFLTDKGTITAFAVAHAADLDLVAAYATVMAVIVCAFMACMAFGAELGAVVTDLLTFQTEGLAFRTMPAFLAVAAVSAGGAFFAFGAYLASAALTSSAVGRVGTHF